MNQNQLERGTQIKGLLEKLHAQKKALSLTQSSNQRRISIGLEGRKNENDTWLSMNNSSLIEALGAEEVISSIDVARILLLEKVIYRINELETEFKNL